MIEILQGETLSFVLDGEDLTNYEVRAALRPSGTSFRRDCSCGESVLSWDDIAIVGGVAAWTLTTEQSATLPIGKYAMEVALRDISTGDDIKDATIDIINVKPSYTR
jgi:hypothetical protein